MTTRKEQKEKRREEILYTGLKLFVKKGYASTKISDIAKEMGVSVGLMFHYFESKEKLYEELIKMGASAPMMVFAMEHQSPILFFETAAKQIFDILKSEPITAYMFVLMNQAFYNEAAPQSVKDLLKNFDIITPTAQLIIQGQKDGTIREGDPYSLSAAFWYSVQGIAEGVALNQGVPCPESNWIVDIIRRK